MSSCAKKCSGGQQAICQSNPDCPSGDRCFLTGAGVGFCFAVAIPDAGGTPDAGGIADAGGGG